MPTPSLDFTGARMRHYLFKSKLRSALYGSTADRTPLLDPHACSLGQWIDHELTPVAGHLAATRELIAQHILIHEEGIRLLALYDAGEVVAAQQGMARLEGTGDRMLELLTILEQELAGETGPLPDTEPDQADEAGDGLPD